MLFDSIQLLEGSKLTNVVVDSGSSFPLLATEGEIFYRSDVDEFYVYNGTGWQLASAALPAQDGNTGKYLTTDGTTASWATVTSGDQLPSQTGNTGKYLTTNGTVASWATIEALPSQTGNTGKYLTTDGTTASWATVASPSPGGTATELQYRNGSSFAGAAQLNYNGTNTLVVGALQAGAFTISGADSPSASSPAGLIVRAGNGNSLSSGGGLTLQAGNSSATDGQGGDIVIAAGAQTGSGFQFTRGGDVSISAGNASNGLGYFNRAGNLSISSGQLSGLSGVGGYVSISSNGVERLRFLPSGAWSVGSNGTSYGTSGQVLLSTGDGPPVWGSLASGVFTFEASYIETLATIASASTTTLNCNTTNVFRVTLGTSITTLAFSNVPDSGKVFTLTLFIEQDGTGGKNVSWPASVKWSGGVVPTLTATANKTDIISLVTHDGGTIWYGLTAGQNF